MITNLQNLTHTTKTPNQQRSWNSVELVGKAAKSAFDFLDYLCQKMPPQFANQAEHFENVKQTLELTLKNMENIAAIEADSN